jgi:hypothetical protein
MNSEIYDIFQASALPASKYDTYFGAYEDLLGKYKNRDITFVEVGVLGGGSLEAWKKYLGSHSRIIGVDLNPALKETLGARGFEIFIGDQSDSAFWKRFYESVGNIDVLLDDGGHSNLQTWTTLKHAIPHVNDGGTIVVEDTHASYMQDFGNPSAGSFISRVKEIVDDINYRSYRIGDEDRKKKLPNRLEGLDVSRCVHSVKFYESIVGFSIDTRLARVPRMVTFGSAHALPDQKVPEDFRYRGIDDPDLNVDRRSFPRKVLSKIRSALFTRRRRDAG